VTLYNVNYNVNYNGFIVIIVDKLSLRIIFLFAYLIFKDFLPLLNNIRGYWYNQR